MLVANNTCALDVGVGEHRLPAAYLGGRPTCSGLPQWECDSDCGGGERYTWTGEWGDSILSWETSGLVGKGAAHCQGPCSISLPPPPPDMLLLKKQTEDISSVYEIREKLGS